MSVEITDELVNQVAIAMYGRNAEELMTVCCGEAAPWQSLLPTVRDWWRDKARVALQVTGAIQAVHLCDSCVQSMCSRRFAVEDICKDQVLPARVVVTECAAYIGDKLTEGVCSITGRKAASGDDQDGDNLRYD